MTWTNILVTGARDWKNKEQMRDALRIYIPPENDRQLVFVGDCPTGVDKAVRIWCKHYNIPHVVFVANWDLYGKLAGPFRNEEMVDCFLTNCSSRNRIALAFRNGSPNIGTQNCIRLLQRRGHEPLVFFEWGTEPADQNAAST